MPLTWKTPSPDRLRNSGQPGPVGGGAPCPQTMGGAPRNVPLRPVREQGQGRLAWWPSAIYRARAHLGSRRVAPRALEPAQEGAGAVIAVQCPSVSDAASPPPGSLSSQGATSCELKAKPPAQRADSYLFTP